MSQIMKPAQPLKPSVIATLRLRGMRVIKVSDKVIHIDKPSADFKRLAVDIIENINGMRRRCSALQFSGFCIRWNEE
ncbi:hypothetical protein [Shewanella sp.]|uniref:hypothetical protein n=1 Tax=Shewanella sp. TaxID=50422 RepID=UPI0040543049